MSNIKKIETIFKNYRRKQLFFKNNFIRFLLMFSIGFLYRELSAKCNKSKKNTG